MSAESVFAREMETFFAAKVNTAYPGTFMLFENGPKKYPENAHWVRFVIVTGDSRIVSIGGRRVKRTVEVLHITVYAPEGAGIRTAKDMGGTMARWFEGQQFQIEGITHYIKFRASRVKTSEDPVSGLHRCIATIDGWRDEPVRDAA